MKRVMLLALLALALPTAALAGPIDFTTGNFVTGLCIPKALFGCFPASQPLGIQITGTATTINIETGTLTQLSSCPGGQVGTCFHFTSGQVFVSDSFGVPLFMDSLAGGLVTQNGSSFTIFAGLNPSASPSVVGGALTASYTFGTVDREGNQRLSSGKATVSLTPEPGTLAMVGTGLIGLAGIARRRLKPWT